MTFSVVIPVYNRISTLKSAIESVLAQTFTDYEIIVVDDGSQSDIRSAIKPYLGRIKYIKLDKNQGVSYARNTGIKESSGEYIAFLDSDDIWLPDKLQAQYYAFKETKLLVCHTNEFWYRGDRFINQAKRHARFGGMIFDKVLDFCRISPSSVAIHKSVFETCGMFDESMRVCEDYDLWLRICSKYEVIYLEKRHIIKRAITDDQLSDSIKHIESIRHDSLKKFIENTPLPPEQNSAAKAELERKNKIITSGLKR
jgi:glycosyltransferase involved in cell wall biosynthesis